MVVKFATDYHMSFFGAQLKRESVATNNDTRWFPPNHLAVKVYFDGAKF